MKAIRVHQFGEPGVMRLEDVSEPTAGTGQVVVRVQAVGVNPVDAYIRSGIYGQREMPYTPGMDAAGIVESVGPGVRRVKVGERVYVAFSITGTYAEKVLCRETQVHWLPPNVTFAQAAGVGVPYGTAYRALLDRGGARAGETVLVHGASGGVGTAAVQFARAAGMTVIGTAGTERGKDLVRQQGAHYVLDHTNPDYLKQLMELTGGRGVDVILEMLANVNLAKDLTVLAKFGRVVVIGSRGPVEIDARNTMKNDADIRGMTLMNATETELLGIHAAIVAGLENGTLRPIVGKEMPLAEADKAHVAVMDKGAYGKIVLVV